MRRARLASSSHFFTSDFILSNLLLLSTLFWVDTRRSCQHIHVSISGGLVLCLHFAPRMQNFMFGWEKSVCIIRIPTASLTPPPTLLSAQPPFFCQDLVFFFLTAQVLFSLYCRYFFVLLSLGAVSLFVCFHIPEVLRNCLCLCCS